MALAVAPELTPVFVVDEAPLTLAQVPETAEADMLTLAARALVEQERLAALAEDLQRTQSQSTDQETLRVLRQLLPVLDSFDAVCKMAEDFEASEELSNWLRSVEGVQARLLQTLERLGLERLDPLGESVDLNRDEVVEYRPTPSHPGDSIIEVRRCGYRFRGKTLRDTQVVVAHNTGR